MYRTTSQKKAEPAFSALSADFDGGDHRKERLANLNTSSAVAS
jgi:hypothetical protein